MRRDDHHRVAFSAGIAAASLLLWVGLAAWPAMFQYASDEEQRVRRQIDEQRREAERLDVVRPEEANRLRSDADRKELELRTGSTPGHWLFGQFERTPSEEAINTLNTSRDKELELGWVYTVIAGVLNILVIYDALVGPAFPSAQSLMSGRGY